MLTKDRLQYWHERGSTYEEYLASASNWAEPWRKVGDQVQLTEAQKGILSNFVRKMNVLVISGVWCGDCSAQGPMLAAIAEASPAIDLHWLDRDEAIELSEQTKINAGNRVPIVIFMAEDYEFVSMFGDRTLSRYRSIAKKQIGSACDIPGIAIPQDEFNATLQEWLNEFERVQLLLRLSTRLRQKHGD
jgi:hypothetical protein|tara:strand:- start:91 stop:657 length:567 start_codon:yes stop_codon:yes gene_type:complete